MQVEHYISNDFPIFSEKDSCQEAFRVARDFQFSHIFVEKNNDFQGAVSVENLEENQNKTIEEMSIYLEKFSIQDKNSLWDGLQLFHRFSTNIIPIMNEKEQYQGYISWENVVGELAKYPVFSESGALLTVEIPRKNYSMTEISQIVEGNNSKIYGLIITEMNEDLVRVTMRISQDNLSSVGSTFERYGYSIVHKFYDDDTQNLLRNRYQFMQKYLEI